MDEAPASFETAWGTPHGGCRWLVFNCDHGCVAEKASILATGRLHGPLKFVAFAENLFACGLM